MILTVTLFAMFVAVLTGAIVAYVLDEELYYEDSLLIVSIFTLTAVALIAATSIVYMIGVGNVS